MNVGMDIGRLEPDAVAAVEALHEFFQSWFRGEPGNDDASFEWFERALAPGFTMVTPDGSTIGRSGVLDRVRRMHGALADNQPPFAIAIRKAEATALGPAACLVTYDEIQTADGPGKARVSTAILLRDDGAPAGLRWLHVHETWLPHEEE